VSDGHNVSEANEQPDRLKRTTTAAAKKGGRILVKFIVPENP
jgi:hypothetical protein